MSDIREDRNHKFDQLAERGNPHGGRGRRAERNMSEEFTTQTGHPLGASGVSSSNSSANSNSSSTHGDRELSGDMPPNTDLSRAQHARQGQAQSPRELTLNQPEKKRK